MKEQAPVPTPRVGRMGRSQRAPSRGPVEVQMMGMAPHCLAQAWGSFPSRASSAYRPINQAFIETTTCHAKCIFFRRLKEESKVCSSTSLPWDGLSYLDLGPSFLFSVFLSTKLGISCRGLVFASRLVVYSCKSMFQTK